MKYERNFVKPRVSEEIKHHDSAAMNKTGLSYVLIDDLSYPNAGLRLTTRRIANVPKEVPDYVEMHSHDVDQLFILLSDTDDSGALEAEFKLEDEVYRVKSPVTVFIPKGVPHSQKVLSGSGRLITFLRKGVYP